MNITTQSIIKILPFDQEFKQTLLDNLEKYDLDTKFKITQLLWDTYFALYELKLQENIDDSMNHIVETNDSLSHDLFTKARDRTNQDMEQELIKTSETVDLTTTREKIEEIIRDASQNASTGMSEPQKSIENS